MIDIELLETAGWGPALHGMRNPLNSWDKADSTYAQVQWLEGCPASINVLGPNDESLMRRLIAAGTNDHCKFRRMISIAADVDAPLYWWKEADTYKVGTVANSCSTMHTIMRDGFEIGMFSTDRMSPRAKEQFQPIIDALNERRDTYIDAKADASEFRRQYRETGDAEMEWRANTLDSIAKGFWDDLIQMLPSSWMQKRTWMLNYEVMANIYKSRRHHKLMEWRDFIDYMVENLPYPWIFTGEGC